MNLKTAIPLVLALVLGLVAAMLGKSMMAKGRQNANPAVKLTKVVVAKEELAPGSTIKDTDIAQRDMPSEGLPPGMSVNPADYVGRVILAQVGKNQVILESLLAPRGSLGGLQAMVPAGKRAITLEVNEVSGVAGLLTPGVHVDVVQTIQAKGDPKSQDSQLMAKTIVENLRVIAVGRRLGSASGNADADSGVARSVTLLATAEQVEAIDLASHLGTPRLVLRNGADNELTESTGTTVAELRGESREATTPVQLSQLAPATKPSTRPFNANYREVEVIRAGAATSVRVATPASVETAAPPTDKLLGTLPQEK